MNLLNVGCGTHYANGWVNTDTWRDEKTKPDILVEPGQPYPFDDNFFDAIYLGHVLEHIEWDRLLDFLHDIQRIARPGAHILVVGPDVYKTLERWKNNQEPWHMVESVLEHQELSPDDTPDWWDGALHHWNCHYQRVFNVMQRAGFVDLVDYTDVVPNDAHGKTWTEPATSICWPVVGKWFWQFALKCKVST